MQSNVSSDGLAVCRRVLLVCRWLMMPSMASFVGRTNLLKAQRINLT